MTPHRRMWPALFIVTILGVFVSEYDWNDFEDDDDQPIDPRSLPKQLRKVIRDAKAEAKQAKEEADKLRQEHREFVVGNVLKAKGVPEKVAKLVPADVTSAEAIETWLSDYGDVFTPSSSTPAPQATGGEQAQDAPASQGQQFIENAATSNGGLTAEEVANTQRMQQAVSTAQPFGGRAEELMAKLNDPDLTEEQLHALIKKGGL
jgi:uncharacterized membrane protein